MQKNRTWSEYLGIGARGMMMGAADAVPGVSGGTIAFMTGIYEELIFSLRQCSPGALRVLFKQGAKAFWWHINGAFLLTLFSGIVLSILSVSHLVLHLLAFYPILLWSFFFGLILAAVWSVVRHIESWTLPVGLMFFAGALIAYWITEMTPTSVEATSVMIFVSGMIAICAMILPGISGSFLLLLLGMYAPMLEAVKNLQLSILALFSGGCIVGLLSFSHVLNWMFKQHKTLTLALLGGFMLGSLNKVWPWKQTLESIIDRHGETVPLVQSNIFPQTFEQLTQQPAYLLPSICLMLLGVALVLVLEKMGNKVGL